MKCQCIAEELEHEQIIRLHGTPYISASEAVTRHFKQFGRSIW